MTGKDDAKFLDDLRSLSLTGAQQLLTGLDRLKQLHEEANTIDPDEVQETKTRLSDLVYKLAKMELEHAESLLSLGNSQADLLFEHVRTLARTARNRGEPPVAVVEFAFIRSAEYAAVTSRFRIHNPFDEDADVRFEVSPFKDQFGAPLVEPSQLAELDQLVKLDMQPRTAPARSLSEVSVTVNSTHFSDAGVYFANLEVHLCASVERLVAKRIIKVKVRNS
jgi:hypothetical protein